MIKRILFAFVLIFSAWFLSFSYAGNKVDNSYYTKLSTSELSKKAGYDWTKDKYKLAQKAGIKNYYGSKSQNLQIKKMLLGKLWVNETKTTKTETKVKTKTKTEYLKLSTSELSKKAGYNWIKDKYKLAQKAGIKNYYGSSSQNLKIREMLLKKLWVK